MICYKDMTFCPFLECGKSVNCARALTEKIKSDAEGFGLLIAEFLEKPGCFEDRKNKKGGICK
jgi:hypothetical protein